MNNKEKFIDIYKTHIKREGSDKLLSFLMSSNSDFFDAPASTRFHGSHDGGLVEHTINVYECLKDYLSRKRVQGLYNLHYSDESIAIVALLHDLCKINCYKKTMRNVKENGQWVQVPSYEFNDMLPYGHGEKSVYMISGYMKLTREEAFAIRYHMGFAGSEEARNVGAAFEMFPLAFALHTADMEATYFVEGKK